MMNKVNWAGVIVGYLLYKLIFYKMIFPDPIEGMNWMSVLYAGLFCAVFGSLFVFVYRQFFMKKQD